MRVANREQVPGGWMVDLEIPNAYTDGTSRFERVFVSRDDVPGNTADELLDAAHDALTNDPAEQAIGQDVTAAQATKAVWEARITPRYARWQMWKTIRVEAQARSLPAAAVTALTNRENAAWTALLDALTAWRQANWSREQADCPIG